MKKGLIKDKYLDSFLMATRIMVPHWTAFPGPSLVIILLGIFASVSLPQHFPVPGLPLPFPQFPHLCLLFFLRLCLCPLHIEFNYALFFLDFFPSLPPYSHLKYLFLEISLSPSCSFVHFFPIILSHSIISPALSRIYSLSL